MKTISWILLLAALLIILSIIFTGNNQNPLTIGDRVADLRLKDLNGNYFFSNDYRGQVIILNFAATWCTYCLEELPYLDKLQQKYRDDGLIVASVFKDYNNIDLAREIKARERLTFPVLTDRKNSIFDMFGVRTLPYTVLIDRQGLIRYIHLGFRSEDLSEYERELVFLLQQER